MIPVTVQSITETDISHKAFCVLQLRNGKKFATELKVFRTPDVSPGHGYILTCRVEGRSKWVALLVNNFVEVDNHGEA